MNQIFIGFDSSNYGQELAYKVCERSIKKYNKTIIIHKLNKKDFNTQKSLIRLVGKRRNQLDYLKDKDIERYRAIIIKLNIRR